MVKGGLPGQTGAIFYFRLYPRISSEGKGLIRKTAPFVAILCIIIDRLNLCETWVHFAAHSCVYATLPTLYES